MLNVVVVLGSLAKPVQVKVLPSGSSLTSFDVVVRKADQVADTVPVVLFDAPQGVPELAAGETILVVGRVRRRFFRSGPSTQSRTEVVADKVLSLVDAGLARSALEEAASFLDRAVDELRVVAE
jgi:single-strand DNA-binding protein